ncbi:MAG: hypothetical protein EHM21_16305, partial [Chloroflexi bacterium]
MEYQWLPQDLQPALPTDWTPYAFLVLELKASSPQYFELALHTPQGARSVRFHPFQGVWVRAAVPLHHFREPLKAGHDLASLGNKPRKTFFVNFHKNQGPLDRVDTISIRIDHPVGQPTVEVRSFRLEKEDPGDAVLGDLPLVDEFGQWILEDLPGKAQSLEDLQASWKREGFEQPASPYQNSRYGGFLGARGEPTGFFRVEQIDGRWWFVDPDGYLFFSSGVDCIAPAGGTHVAGREEIFRALPPFTLRASIRHGSPADFASFEAWNLHRR